MDTPHVEAAKEDLKSRVHRAGPLDMVTERWIQWQVSLAIDHSLMQRLQALWNPPVFWESHLAFVRSFEHRSTAFHLSAERHGARSAEAIGGGGCWHFRNGGGGALVIDPAKCAGETW
eukprot:690759-Amphidinium_carterae.1